MLYKGIVLPSKPNTIPVSSFVERVGGQDYITKRSPQCPKHLYILETQRGEEPDTLTIEACNKCVIEAEMEKELPNIIKGINGERE